MNGCNIIINSCGRDTENKYIDSAIVYLKSNMIKVLYTHLHIVLFR